MIIMVNVEMYCTSKYLLSIFQVESCWTIARISSTFSWFEVRFSKMSVAIGNYSEILGKMFKLCKKGFESYDLMISSYHTQPLAM